METDEYSKRISNSSRLISTGSCPREIQISYDKNFYQLDSDDNDSDFSVLAEDSEEEVKSRTFCPFISDDEELPNYDEVYRNSLESNNIKFNEDSSECESNDKNQVFGMDVEYSNIDNSVDQLSNECTKLSNHIKQLRKIIAEKDEIISKLKIDHTKKACHDKNRYYLKQRNKEYKLKNKMEAQMSTMDVVENDDKISENVKVLISLLLHKR